MGEEGQQALGTGRRQMSWNGPRGQGRSCLVTVHGKAPLRHRLSRHSSPAVCFGAISAPPQPQGPAVLALRVALVAGREALPGLTLAWSPRLM